MPYTETYDYIDYIGNKHYNVYWEADSFTLSGNLVLPTGATTGFVLTSDSNGNATWQASGSGSYPDISDTAGVQVTIQNGVAFVSYGPVIIQPNSDSLNALVVVDRASAHVFTVDTINTKVSTYNFSIDLYDWVPNLQLQVPTLTGENSTTYLGNTRHSLFLLGSNTNSDRSSILNLAGNLQQSSLADLVNISSSFNAAQSAFIQLYGFTTSGGIVMYDWTGNSYTFENGINYTDFTSGFAYFTVDINGITLNELTGGTPIFNVDTSGSLSVWGNSYLLNQAYLQPLADSTTLFNIRNHSTATTIFNVDSVAGAVTTLNNTLDDGSGNSSVLGFKMVTGASVGLVLTSDGSGVGSWQIPTAATSASSPLSTLSISLVGTVFTADINLTNANTWSGVQEFDVAPVLYQGGTGGSHEFIQLWEDITAVKTETWSLETAPIAGGDLWLKAHTAGGRFRISDSTGYDIFDANTPTQRVLANSASGSNELNDGSGNMNIAHNLTADTFKTKLTDFTSITATGSPFTFTNPTTHNIQVFISSDNLATDVVWQDAAVVNTFDFQGLAQGFTIVLRNGESVVVSYSAGAPSMSWISL
jgi:hypothetical protein